jgi:allantoinase
VSDIVLRSRRVVTPRGLHAAAVHVEGGIVRAITNWADVKEQSHVTDVGDAVVMPGLVDTHVHVNEPGRTEWEGFDTATRAAAAGGVTTLLDMPLNSIPATTTVAALEVKRRAAEHHCWVNTGFIGGVVPGNARDLAPLHEAGVRAFKCFLVPSGVDEFPAVDESDLREALPVLAQLKAPLMVHAELPPFIPDTYSGDPRRYDTWLGSRPDDAELHAVELVARLAEEYGATIHIVHLSSERTLRILREARERGVAITAETCPHYLTFSAEEIADGATQYKCAPPIRVAKTRDALWRALLDGEIDGVVSDHSPCPPDLKCETTGNFFDAWGGIASLQLGLPAIWEGARARSIGPERLAAWMSAAPAKLAGLQERKGCLVPGCDADIVVWNADAEIVVTPEMLEHRHKVTPYLGRHMHGQVQLTYIGGSLVYDHGRFVGTPHGALI